MIAHRQARAFIRVIVAGGKAKGDLMNSKTRRWEKRDAHTSHRLTRDTFVYLEGRICIYVPENTEREHKRQKKRKSYNHLN